MVFSVTPKLALKSFTETTVSFFNKFMIISNRFLAIIKNILPFIKKSIAQPKSLFNAKCSKRDKNNRRRSMNVRLPYIYAKTQKNRGKNLINIRVDSAEAFEL
ncbi:hypothetical protein SDC9_148367 [bioreactor metagenome]|uniref:Uncharacterized protein n=1 Tax=bioreactor metagenome TaxID=1076179 RepID=A0A645EGW1_9ZZZZ